MDRGRWAEAADHLRLALATVDEYRLHDYVMSALAFAAAARLAVHRGDRKEVDRQLARAMRARPVCTFALPWLAVRLRLQLAKVYAAIADDASARHLLLEIDDILLHRPALGALIDQVSELRETLMSSAHVGSIRGDASDVRRSFGCCRTCRRISPSARSGNGFSCPATPSAPKSARSIESWACPHAAARCNRRRRSACSAGSRGSPAGLVFQGRVDVIAERHRQPWSGRDNAGESDDGDDAEQHLDDLGGGRTRRSSRHRSRRRRTGPRHRPRPARRGGPGPASSDRVFRTRPRQHRPR